MSNIDVGLRLWYVLSLSREYVPSTDEMEAHLQLGTTLTRREAGLISGAYVIPPKIHVRAINGGFSLWGAL